MNAHCTFGRFKIHTVHHGMRSKNVIFPVPASAACLPAAISKTDVLMFVRFRIVYPTAYASGRQPFDRQGW